MGLFQAIVRTVVNVATLPVPVVKDVLGALPEAGDREVGSRIRAHLEKIKDEASTDEEDY